MQVIKVPLDELHCKTMHFKHLSKTRTYTNKTITATV